MAYRAKINLSTFNNNANYSNAKGNHECVTLVQQTSSVPHTTQWKQGRKVLLAPTEVTIPLRLPIRAGTIISTFDKNGKYPIAKGRHAAIYVSHNNSGITVYDQWNRQGMSKKRVIRVKNFSNVSSDDAAWFYVVD